MRFSVILPFTLLGSMAMGAAVPSFKEDEGEPVPVGPDAISQSLDTIVDRIKSLNETVSKFEGGSIKGVFELLEIKSKSDQLGDAIDNSSAVTNKTGKLDVAASTTVGTKILGLQPDIFSLLDNIKSKKPEAEKAGFGLLDVVTLLRGELTTQKEKTRQLGSAFTASLDAALAPQAGPVNQGIQDRFDSTIEVYQGEFGLIQLPEKLVDILGAFLRIIGPQMAMSGQGDEMREMMKKYGGGGGGGGGEASASVGEGGASASVQGEGSGSGGGGDMMGGGMGRMMERYRSFMRGGYDN
ncbi:hydrophobic surface binding protein A-domain-containing protein [Phyllosticta capitalensis]